MGTRKWNAIPVGDSLRSLDFHYQTWRDEFESRFIVIPQIETRCGVENAASIAGHPLTTALGWGPYDLSADLGCWASEPSPSRCLRACRGGGRRKEAVDVCRWRTNCRRRHSDLDWRSVRHSAAALFQARGAAQGQRMKPKQAPMAVRSGFWIGVSGHYSSRCLRTGSAPSRLHSLRVPKGSFPLADCEVRV